MGLFSSAKAKLAAQKLAEEKLYEIAADEIAALYLNSPGQR